MKPEDFKNEYINLLFIITAISHQSSTSERSSTRRCKTVVKQNVYDIILSCLVRTDSFYTTSYPHPISNKDYRVYSLPQPIRNLLISSMIVFPAKSSLILPSFFALVTIAPAQTRGIQYLGC